MGTDRKAMTLATSSSVHQLQQRIDDRQAEIRRNAERARLSAWNVAALPLVFANGVDDLTAPVMNAAAASLPKSVAPRRWSWLLRFEFITRWA
jgi:hypothetical protein